MRAPRFPAISFSSSPFAVSSTAIRGRPCFPPPAVRSRNQGFCDGGSKYWDKFYKRHQNKFFKDRHYLEKDWGKYFSDDSSASPNGKVVLEVGCGAGNTVFPLVAKHPKLFVHACDFSPHAIAIVKIHRVRSGFSRSTRLQQSQLVPSSKTSSLALGCCGTT